MLQTKGRWIIKTTEDGTKCIGEYLWPRTELSLVKLASFNGCKHWWLFVRWWTVSVLFYLRHGVEFPLV